jgi:hypothetical protein
MAATTNFLPTREADLVIWSNNFSAKINATPTAYGLTAAQASTYRGLHNTFVAASQTANNPATRSPSNIMAKDTAKAALIANARLLARIIQTCPTVTDTQRTDLGLTVRSGPTPVPAPSIAPGLEIVSTTGNTVRIRLHDSPSTRRGKPAGVTGAAVFSFVGAVAPTDSAAWKFEGNTSRTVLDVTFPGTTAPGARVWFTAFWFNQKKQSSPACAPTGTNIPGGSAMAA